MNTAGTNTQTQNGIDPVVAGKLRKLLHDWAEAMAQAARDQQIPAWKINGAGPSNAIVMMDSTEIHIVFERISSGMSTEYIFHWPNERLSQEVAGATAVQSFGFTDQKASVISFQKSVVDMAEPFYKAALTGNAQGLSRALAEAANRPQTIAGYSGMQPYLDKFSNDHPSFEQNVFVAMRFDPSQQHQEIYATIKSTLAEFGLKALRADEKLYPTDGDLWANICTYMMGCKLGICVFEEINARDFNPNVPMEYGFMRAMDRQVLLLKDQRQPRMPTDIVGKVYRDFDTYSIATTLAERIREWCSRDLGRKATA